MSGVTATCYAMNFEKIRDQGLEQKNFQIAWLHKNIARSTEQLYKGFAC